MSLTLTLPLPPNVANQRKHWRAKIRQRHDYWQRLEVLRHMRKIPKPPKDWPPATVRITVTLYVWAYMDPDNAMARLKWTLDWLSAWDYILDDNPVALQWSGMPTQEIDRKDQRLEITLEAV